MSQSCYNRNSCLKIFLARQALSRRDNAHAAVKNLIHPACTRRRNCVRRRGAYTGSVFQNRLVKLMQNKIHEILTLNKAVLFHWAKKLIETSKLH